MEAEERNTRDKILDLVYAKYAKYDPLERGWELQALVDESAPTSGEAVTEVIQLAKERWLYMAGPEYVGVNFGRVHDLEIDLAKRGNEKAQKALERRCKVLGVFEAAQRGELITVEEIKVDSETLVGEERTAHLSVLWHLGALGGQALAPAITEQGKQLLKAWTERKPWEQPEAGPTLVEEVKPVRATMVMIFLDIINSTPIGDTYGEEELVGMQIWLHDKVLQSKNEKGLECLTKFLGDGFMLAFPDDDRYQAADSALAFCRDLLVEINTEYNQQHPHTQLSLRVGVHRGEVRLIRESTGELEDIVGLQVAKAQRIQSVSEELMAFSFPEGSRHRVWISRQLSQLLEEAAPKWLQCIRGAMPVRPKGFADDFWVVSMDLEACE